MCTPVNVCVCVCVCVSCAAVSESAELSSMHASVPVDQFLSILPGRSSECTCTSTPISVHRPVHFSGHCSGDRSLHSHLSVSGVLPGGLQVKRRASRILARLAQSDPLTARKLGSTPDSNCNKMDWLSCYAIAVNEGIVSFFSVRWCLFVLVYVRTCLCVYACVYARVCVHILASVGMHM
jgi:hypothetical protein